MYAGCVFHWTNPVRHQSTISLELVLKVSAQRPGVRERCP
jgi:hypothetical protein